MNSNKRQKDLNSQNDWYFGSITRSEAEDILIKNGLSEGLFLVRKSVSSPGDYVLSSVQKGLEIQHYQIRRIGQEPFFAIDNEIVIYGLDMVFKRLKELSEKSENFIIIENHCRAKSPPPETRRYGRSNLLHRAIACAEHRIVYELLRTDDRINVEARDEKGRTAMHLAVQLDEHSNGRAIVKLLIKAGANVNCRDSESITPLHLCAKLNKPKFAKLLLAEGKATTFCRTEEQVWAPLHFAAYLGNIKVVKVLLHFGAAPHPRDSRNETPTELALKQNHLKCRQLCDSYTDRPLDSLWQRNQWLFEHIPNRYETNRLFEESGMRNGSFFVRKSKTKQHSYVLSMAYDLRIYNFEIQNNEKYHFIDCGPYWPSLDHLIHYYMGNSDGLPSRLSAPISSFIDISINKELIVCNTEDNNDLVYSNKSDSNNESIKSILFIDNNELRIENLIGTGEYGDVLKAIWRRSNKKSTLVAIKTLRKQEFTQMRRKIDNFLKEVEVLSIVKHINIIQFLGVCISPHLMIVQELAPMGSVRHFLIDHSSEVDISHDIKLWSKQIAIGMRYLEERHFIHRDLAARNVLLASIHQIKISDFGLSRALRGDEDFYTTSNKDRLPLKWYAPEALVFGTFTHASDVWSYGVVLWEMYSLGEEPYGDIENSQIIKFIDDGKRLSKPNHCTDMLFALISLCWSYEPKNRPTFDEIVRIMFTNDYKYESISFELKSTIEI